MFDFVFFYFIFRKSLKKDFDSNINSFFISFFHHFNNFALFQKL
jgi:hypothetical protein